MEFIASALAGIILGGGFTAILGIAPAKSALADFRVEMSKELGKVGERLGRLETAFAASPFVPYDRRSQPRKDGSA